MSDEREPTAAEIQTWRRDNVLLPAGRRTAEEFPRLNNMSAGFLFGGVIRPLEPTAPEYVALPMLESSGLEMVGAVGKWNLLWEAAQYRRRFFDVEELPTPMAQIAELGDVNVTFVPRTRSRYFEYAPLLHLLPARVLDTFGLPTLRGGQWPFMADHARIDDFLSTDFEQRLTQAWAWLVWPHLVSGSRMSAFSNDDPIRLLAHNLDFWVPAVTATIQNRLRDPPFGRTLELSQSGPGRFLVAVVPRTNSFVSAGQFTVIGTRGSPISGTTTGAQRQVRPHPAFGVRKGSVTVPAFTRAFHSGRYGSGPRTAVLLMCSTSWPGWPRESPHLRRHGQRYRSVAGRSHRGA